MKVIPGLSVPSSPHTGPTGDRIKPLLAPAAGPRRLLCFAFAPLPDTLQGQLKRAGWLLTSFVDVASAACALQGRQYGVGLLFIDDWTAGQCETLRSLLHSHYDCEWVGVFSGNAQQVAGCSDLVLGYLFDHHTLPVDLPHLLRTLGHAYGRHVLRQQLSPQPAPAQQALLAAQPAASPARFSRAAWQALDNNHNHNDKAGTGSAATKPLQPILGQSPAIKALLRQIRKVAGTDAPVLIGGESGSGKELAAHAIHQHSRRSAAPFIAVNCGALPASLIQAELFGATRGAYTGAVRDRKGLLEAANGGTIFLDEIADLPLEMQINLLRFLQEQTITPVGASTTTHVDVRVVAAANVDLQLAVQHGRFRQDLFYRLNVVPITVPPLRERREDIVLLAEHFFARHAADRAARLLGFSAAAMRAMLSHEWPGNVREMINRVRCALVMSEGRLIRPHDLGLSEAGSSTESVERARQEAERTAVSAALARSHRNITHAARELGVSRMTLYRMIERHQLDRGASPTSDHAAPLASIKKNRSA